MLTAGADAVELRAFSNTPTMHVMGREETAAVAGADRDITMPGPDSPGAKKEESDWTVEVTSGCTLVQKQAGLSSCCNTRFKLPCNTANFMWRMGTAALSFATANAMVIDTLVAFATYEDSVIETPDSEPASHSERAKTAHSSTVKVARDSKHDAARLCGFCPPPRSIVLYLLQIVERGLLLDCDQVT